MRLPVLLLLVCLSAIATLPSRAQTPPSQPTVITSTVTNPAKPTGDRPEPQNQIAPGNGTPTPGASSFNALILEAVAAMPGGGTYRANTAAVSALRSAVQTRNSQLVLNPTQATPSFCSGATYLIFLSVLDRLQREGRLALDDATLGALLVQEHQPDGVGVWGRWNANGPGTARLFQETGLGHNFTSFDEAKPGDFLKVFWNDEIGVREAGHSVIYLGMVTRPEGEFVSYWSSNLPDGFGRREIPMQRIHRALFSRLEHPEQIRHISSVPARDAYLAAMLKRPSSGEEMAQMVGIKDSPIRPLTTLNGPSNKHDHPSVPAKSPSTPPAVTTVASTPTPSSKGLRRLWPFGGHHTPAPSATPSLPNAAH